MPALLVQLEPFGPWRNGPASGARDRVDTHLSSDTLFAALCRAFAALGLREAWLDATQGSAPAVRLTSLFPWHGEHLYLPPPRHLWPPAQGSGRLRAHGARFVSARALAAILAGQPLRDDSWAVDSLSQCLIPRSAPGGPYRVALRSHAAVDRTTPGHVEVHRTACLEFAVGGGYWCAAECTSPAWTGRLEAAFRWLADTGLGGERSLGWGQSRSVRFERGELAALLGLPTAGQAMEGAVPGTTRAYWLLSLLAPAPADSIGWERGNYSLVRRDSAGLSLIGEGSVLVADSPPTGRMIESKGEAGRAPRQRWGIALSLPVAYSPGVPALQLPPEPAHPAPQVSDAEAPRPAPDSTVELSLEAGVDAASGPEDAAAGRGRLHPGAATPEDGGAE